MKEKIKILLTGHNGLLGNAIYKELKKKRMLKFIQSIKVR